MNYKVIYFVNKLKSASMLNQGSVLIPYSDLVLDLTDCLYREGFIQSYEINFKNEEEKKIKIFTRTYNGKTLTSTLKLVSTPTKKKCLTYQDMCSFDLKKTELILTTTLGVFSLSECKRKQIGGIIVLSC